MSYDEYGFYLEAVMERPLLENDIELRDQLIEKQNKQLNEKKTQTDLKKNEVKEHVKIETKDDKALTDANKIIEKQDKKVKRLKVLSTIFGTATAVLLVIVLIL